MTGLFTRIAVTEAASMIKETLNQDETLKDIYELSVDQITTQVEICLNTTHFCYNRVFYKHKKGAAIGSQVAPIVGNLYIEHFEEREIREAPHPHTPG